MCNTSASGDGEAGCLISFLKAFAVKGLAPSCRVCLEFLSTPEKAQVALRLLVYAWYSYSMKNGV